MKPKTLPIILLCILGVGTVMLASAESLPAIQNGKVPQNLADLWGGYAPRQEALETEVLKEWEQDGVKLRIVRFQVGVFKGVPAKVAAFYGFPKGATKLPGLLQMHGGGQSASLACVLTDAKRGYACLSINWGGNKMSLGTTNWDGLQTDWGRLDATHPPQRNQANHFAGGPGPLLPDEYTLDPVRSPRNSNWFIVLLAARRALTFLEQQPEVEPTRLGAYGHSMGGKLTTDLAGIDRRVHAAVASCGGAGAIQESQTELPGCVKSKPSDLELATIADNAYIPAIACPVLWLSPANDFNAPIDNMAWNWLKVPDGRCRFSISPHLNHRHRNEHALTQLLWFEQHLKAAFTLPKTPLLQLDLGTAQAVPLLTVTPDCSFPVKRVDIYYSIDPHTLSRFWRDARAVKDGAQWKAFCPVLSLAQPLFAYADVIYDTPAQYRNVAQTPGCGNSDVFAISSRVLSASQAQLQAAGVKPTDKLDRMIDDGARGWHDWYRLNWDHPPLWRAATRKLKDPKWRGPDGARLVFEIQCAVDNTLVVGLNCNAWGAFLPSKPAADYAGVKHLKGDADWQTVSVSLGDLAAADPRITAPLANWQTVTELSLGPSGQIVKEGQTVKIDGKPWQGAREIRNLRWEGGGYSTRQSTESALSPKEHEHQFNDAIKKSLEQEKRDQKDK